MSERLNRQSGRAGIEMVKIGLIYFVLAELSLLLVVPPGYAVSLWLPAGWALLALNRKGMQFWPGIWLAAFIKNLGQYAGGWDFSTLDAAQWSIAAFAAGGAALQAIAGAYWTRAYFVPASSMTYTARWLFGLGPLACVISATTGTLAQVLLHDLSKIAALGQWITWWSGDVSSVLAIAPWLRNQAHDHCSVERQRRLVAIFLSVSITSILALGCAFYQHHDKEILRHRFETHALSIAGRIDTRLEFIDLNLRALGGLFNLSSQVGADAFSRFNQNLVFPAGVAELAWAPAEMTDTGSLHFPLKLVYVVPGSVRHPAINDANQFLSAALQRAVDRNRRVTVPHQNSTNAEPEWWMIIPIYQANFNAEDAHESARRQALRGYTLAHFHTRPLYADLVEEMQQENMAWRHRGLSDWNRDAVLFEYSTPPKRLADFTYNSTRITAGSGFQIEAWNLDPWQPGYTQTSLVLLVAVQLLLFAVVLLITGSLAHLRRLVGEIDERIQIENRLSHSEAALRRAQAVASIGSWRLDMEANRLIWSNETYQIFGLSLATELSYTTFLQCVHPDDRASVDTAWQAALHGAPYRIEHRIVVNEQIRWVEERAELEFDAQGRLVAGIGTVQDITERKRQEEKLNLLLQAVEQSPNTIVITDPDANIEYANPAFTLSTGYRLDEALGRNPRLLQSGKTLPETYVEMWSHLSEGTAWNGEFINRRKDGSEYTEWARVSPVRQSNGKITHYLAIKEDITEFKAINAELDKHREHLEELVERRTAELAEAKHAAEAANRAKSDFLAAMSHEIRTPMNGVIGLLDVLMQSNLKEHQIKTATLIRDSAYALLGIINDILDFSKIEADKLVLESSALSVDVLLEKICALLERIAVKKHVELLLFVAPNVPTHLIGDELRLGQILNNLINNAIKFSSGLQQPGRVSVRVELHECDAQCCWLNFCVTDNGIGMDAATQARLFAPFEQADGSTTRRYGGTGLGLVIARRLAQLMGGDIQVNSQLGLGSTFNLRIPLGLATPTTGLADSAWAVRDVLLIGARDDWADDIARHLSALGLRIHRIEDAATINQATTTASLWIWLFNVAPGGGKPRLEALRAAVPTALQDVKHWVISRGRRHHPRREADDVVHLDGNWLTRTQLLQALSLVLSDLTTVAASHPVYPALAVERTMAVSPEHLILVAEDNEVNQEVVRQQLALLGLAVDIAADGQEALQRWRNGCYVLLLTDLHMPNLDGYDLTQAIRAEEMRTGRPRMPIIALTANALKGEAERCLAIGMDAYLTKPIPFNELRAAMETWLPHLSTPIRPAPSSVAPTPTLAVLDLAVLTQMVGNSPVTIRKFLTLFINTAAPTAVELQIAFTEHQTQTLGLLAHKLKSPARSVGAMALGACCEQLEKAGKAGDTAALPELMVRFHAEMTAVEQAVADYLNAADSAT